MLTQNVWVRQVSIMHSEVRGQLHHPHVKVLSVTSPSHSAALSLIQTPPARCRRPALSPCGSRCGWWSPHSWCCHRSRTQQKTVLRMRLCHRGAEWWEPGAPGRSRSWPPIFPPPWLWIVHQSLAGLSNSVAPAGTAPKPLNMKRLLIRGCAGIQKYIIWFLLLQNSVFVGNCCYLHVLKLHIKVLQNIWVVLFLLISRFWYLLFTD